MSQAQTQWGNPNLTPMYPKQGHSINIPQVPTQTAQLDLLKEGLFPTQKDNHAIYGTVSKYFYFYI